MFHVWRGWSLRCTMPEQSLSEGKRKCQFFIDAFHSFEFLLTENSVENGPKPIISDASDVIGMQQLNVSFAAQRVTKLPNVRTNGVDTIQP